MPYAGGATAHTEQGMSWITEALYPGQPDQPEHPNDCDLCERVAKMIATLAAMHVMVVRLPCGSVTAVGVHHFQMN